MKFANLLTRFYFEPWMIRQDKHEAMGQLLHDYLQSPRAMSSEEESCEAAARTPMEIHSGVAWIPIHGVLGKHLSALEMMCGGADYDQISEMISVALADERVHTLLLDINSPGGMGVGLPELAAQIRAASDIKPVVAFTDCICCSAGYWIASQAGEFYVTPSSQSVNVGTYIAAMDNSREWEMKGWKRELFSSGKIKALGVPGTVWTDEHRSFLQARVDKHAGQFRREVLASRPDVSAENLEGQWFDGDDAVSLGFADGLVNRLDDVVMAILAARQ